MSYDRNDYEDINYFDAPVPPHLPILRCEHHKEAHIKQSRHPSTIARGYYYCPYTSVSNIILHVWILCNLTLTSFFACPNRIAVDSFSGLIDLRRLIHKSFYSRMIGMSLLRCVLSSVGFFHHQIHRQWQMRRRTKQVPVMSTIHLLVNVTIVLSWWTLLPGWITHCFLLSDSFNGNTR
jgi:hypothetical protein